LGNAFSPKEGRFMYTHLLRAALAASVVLLPVRSEAQPSSLTARPPQQGSQAVVGELLARRQELSLTGVQFDSLTALSSRIRADHGQIRIVRFDRVPGKWVPEVARVYPVQRAARDMALRILTPDQRAEAGRVLNDREPVTTARR
jgi:hypothetical protein